MSGKREHFGPCNVFSRDDERFPASRWTGLYPTMEGAIDALDPFQGTHHVGLTRVDDHVTGKRWHWFET